MNHTELEMILKNNVFLDSTPDFDRVWNKYQSKTREEVDMAEKKSGFKLFVWFASFCILLIVGWFFLLQYTTIVKKEKINKGEAIVATAVVGDVMVKKMGASDWKKLYVEDILQMGDYVKTGKDSFCELQMVNRGLFRVDAQSEVYLATLINVNDRIQSKMMLAKGGIGLKPKKLEKGEVFEVHTESAVAAVRGTKFYVGVDEYGNTKVAVTEGKVSITPVMKSVEKAKEEGLVDEKVAEKIKEKVVKPIEVKQGEEVNVEKKKVEKIDKALSEVVKETATTKGPITVEKIGGESENKIEEVTKTIQEKVEEKVALELPVKKGGDLTTTLVERKEISEEVKKKLEMITEDRIIKKIEEKVKFTFDSNPRGSKVFVNGKEVGVTPLELIFNKSEKLDIRIEKEGFESFSQEYVASGDIRIEPTLKEKLQEIVTEKVAEKESSSISSSSASSIVMEPGSLEWEKSLNFNFEGFDYAPIFYKGKIYGVSLDKLLIFSIEGKLINSIQVAPNSQLTRLAVEANRVIVGSDSGGIFAYSTDGKLLWKYPDAGSQKFGNAPVIYGKKVYFATLEQNIKIYSLDGELLEEVSVSSPIYSAPAIVDNGKKIIYAMENGMMVCYDLESKTEVWKKATPERILYPIISGGGAVFALIRKTGDLIAYSVADGNILWSLKLPEIQKTEIDPVYSDGYIILMKSQGDNSTAVIVNAVKGKVVSKINIPEKTSFPYVLDNKMFIGSKAGKVYCYDIKTGDKVWIAKTERKDMIFVVADEKGIYGLSGKNLLKFVK